MFLLRRAGSPPRMRGKPFSLKYPVLSIRITPADAGKTLMRGCKRRLTTDHPRGCGENTPTLARLAGKRGSPPRMRGKLVYPNTRDKHMGITPADAGKTARSCARACGSQDHPRGCGENRQVLSGAGLRRGSPPRMRGKHRTAKGVYNMVGITPADAGKTRNRNLTEKVS